MIGGECVRVALRVCVFVVLCRRSRTPITMNTSSNLAFKSARQALRAAFANQLVLEFCANYRWSPMQLLFNLLHLFCTEQLWLVGEYLLIVDFEAGVLR